MKYGTDHAWAEIALDRVVANYRAIQELAGENCRVMAVLKANAYGHGAAPIALALEEHAGCPVFAVATLQEAMELREAGVKGDIVLLGPMDETHLERAVEEGIILSLFGLDHAKSVNTRSGALGLRPRVIITTDCGLSRFGIVLSGRTEQAAKEAAQIARMEHLECHSVMTHLTVAGDEMNRQQFALFDAFYALLEQEGVRLPRHCCESRLTVYYPDHHYDYVRPGADLYGFRPYYGIGPHFLPAMELKTRIAHIKWVEPGTAVSYGPVFTAQRRTRLGVLPIGYVDGLRPELGNRISVLVRGQRVPQVGRLCMDYCMIDLTDCPEAQEGDVVTLFGEDNGAFLSVQEYAAVYGGSPSELTCLLGQRVPRVHLWKKEL